MSSERDNTRTDLGPVAPFYSGRTPYLPEFFRVAAQASGLTKTDTVLDLACGTGELAAGIAPYCGTVYAIEKSPEMLARRGRTPANVFFLHADVDDGGAIAIPERAFLALIGRAVHFFKRERLLTFLDGAMAAHASVLICGGGLTPSNPWLSAFEQLLKGYGRRGLSMDAVTGKDHFRDSAWMGIREIGVHGSVKLGLPELLRYALSYSSIVSAILNDKANFEQELARLMAPYCGPSQQIDASIVSWSIQYSRIAA